MNFLHELQVESLSRIVTAIVSLFMITVPLPAYAGFCDGGLGPRVKPDEIVEQIMKRGEKKAGLANRDMAYAYRYGYGVEKDTAKALNYFSWGLMEMMLTRSICLVATTRLNVLIMKPPSNG